MTSHRIGNLRPDQRRDSSQGYIESDVVYVEDDEIDLHALWDIILRRRWLILLVLSASLLGTALATYLTTPIYRATTTLQINKETAKIFQYQDVSPVETDFYDQDFLQTQYELLQSRTLTKRVIDQLSLYSNPDFIPVQQDISIRKLLGLVVDSKADMNDPERFVDKFLKDLVVEPVKRSRLVRIHYNSANPQLAATISRTVAESFINLNLERRFDASSYAKNFISDRIREVKSRLEESERKLVGYARKLEIVSLDEERQPLILQQLQETGLSLAKAEQERISAEVAYREMTQGEGRVFSNVLANPVVQELKHEIAKLESEYQEKLQIYKPAYPSMSQLRKRIVSLQDKIDAEVVLLTRAYESDYLSAFHKQESLAARLEELKQEALNLQDNSINYSILKREVDTNRQLYEGLLQRLKEVGVAGGVGVNNISVVDYPEVPRFSFKPNLQLNLLLAFIVSLFAGTGLAFLVEYFDDSVKSVDDLENKSQIPVIGAIPDVSYFHSEILGAQQIGLLSFTQPDSILAEAFRSTRTSLMFSGPNGAPAVMQVTSPSPGEGKTTSAVNIATAFGQMDAKVLIIDADLRNPSIHHVLGLSNQRGLTNYLVGEVSAAEVSCYTGIAKIFAIPAGPIPPNPAELLSGGRLKDLLMLAEQKFDYVVVDGPPVMGLADALILANQVHGTLVVAESGGTRYRDMEHALKRLRSTHARLVGWVLSKHRMGRGGYGYHSYYYGSEKNLPTASPVQL